MRSKNDHTIVKGISISPNLYARVKRLAAARCMPATTWIVQAILERAERQEGKIGNILLSKTVKPII